MKTLTGSVRLILVLSLLAASGIGQSVTPLHNDDIVKMIKAGLSAPIVVSMIKAQATAFNMSADDLIALKTAGIPDDVIAAMVSKGQPASSATPAGSPTVVDDTTAALDIGVYFKRKTDWVEILPEPVNWKTGGVFKNLASAGMVKGDINGHINGGHSKTSVLTPVEFLIKTPEGVAITEYQLISLHGDQDAREFRAVTGGVLHTSSGADRDLVPFDGKKLATRTFYISLPQLGPGEYGFLPPGSFASGSSASSLGKMFTFRVAE